MVPRVQVIFANVRKQPRGAGKFPNFAPVNNMVYERDISSLPPEE
jgi:hypothetical protein